MANSWEHWKAEQESDLREIIRQTLLVRDWDGMAEIFHWVLQLSTEEARAYYGTDPVVYRHFGQALVQVLVPPALQEHSLTLAQAFFAEISRLKEEEDSHE